MRRDRSEAEDLYEFLETLAVFANEPIEDPLASLPDTLRHVEALMLSAEYKKALKLLTPILKELSNLRENKKYLERDLVMVVVKVADCYVALGKSDKAIKIFEKYAKTFKHNSRFWVAFSHMYLKINRPIKAALLLDEVYENGDFKESIEILSAITGILEGEEEAAAYENYRLLNKHIERLTAKRPNDTATLDLCAYAFYKRGEYLEALDILRRLVKKTPFDPLNHFKRGVIYEEMGRIPLALISYGKAMAIDETDGEITDLAMQMIANIDSRQLGEIAERAAVDVEFYKALKKNPEQTVLKNGYFLSPYGMQFLSNIDGNRLLN